jgi:hypothetical protein
MPHYHFERALFVVGEPNSGKSTQLRSMFRDVRLGHNGDIPISPKLRDVYRLSNERSLYVRITSPHENRESLKGFLDKTEDKITKNRSYGVRWNFACPLQPNPAYRMPDVVTTIRAFVPRFKPERTRVVFLSPDWHGANLQEAAHSAFVKPLLAIRSVETCWINALNRTANGLLLADFFDFT